MIVDSLTFVGESLFGVRASADDLLARMGEAGIDRAVVCPLKPRGYHLAAANEAVAEAVRAHPDRLVGFARVDPWLGEEAVGPLRVRTREAAEHIAGEQFLSPLVVVEHVSPPCTGPAAASA